MKKITALLLGFVMLWGMGLSCEAANHPQEKSQLQKIVDRGYLMVGTTGDFKPMSYYNQKTGSYEGFDIAAAQMIAKSLNVEVRFVKTTWPTLLQDTLDNKFDFAMSGITRTLARQQKADLSQGYITFGKTALMRAGDEAKYPTLAAMNTKDVRVGVNPGGTNEKFVRQYLPAAVIVVHQKNAEIPGLVAEGTFDIMITDSMEAVRYSKEDPRLAAPLLETPFTKNNFAIMMKRSLNGDASLLNYVNAWFDEMKLQGGLAELEQKYIQ